jgi:hypothetical protein
MTKTQRATEFRISSQDDVTRSICYLVEQTRDAHADMNPQHGNRLMNKHGVNSHYLDYPPVCKLRISKTVYLKSIRSALLGVLIAMPTYASADVVTCFPDVEAYMVAQFGPAFRDDENLVVQDKVFGKTRFSLVMDRTSGTNVSHALLRANARKEMCVVLTTPPTVELTLVSVDAAGVPVEFKSVDQAPPGMPANEIFYRRTRGTQYAIVLCNHLTWNGQRQNRKRAACGAS